MKKAIIFSCPYNRIQRSAGPHRIANYLRAHDMDVEVIDFASQLSLEKLQELVRSRYSNDIVFFGFSTFFNHWNHTLNQFTEWLKETYPSVATVIGGQNVLFTNASYIDYWIDSYGEIAMLQLVKQLCGSGDPVDYEIIEEKKVIKALHAYPAYNLDSYSIKYESRDFLEPYEFVTVELSRGCKFKCSFCSYPVLGLKEDVSRDANDLQEELLYNYDNFGITRYMISDETINDRVEKVIKVANVVDQLPFTPWFNGFVRADLLINHKPHWDHYTAMQLGGHYYGVETFNHKSGKVVRKGIDPGKMKSGLLEAREYFSSQLPYRGTISLIAGLPGETTETFLSGINWTLDNWTDQAISVYNLVLPNDTSKDTNLSEFSKNPGKFGFRTGNVIKIKNLQSKGSEMTWEHDTMNHITSKQLVEDFNKNHMKKFRPSGWLMFSITNLLKTTNMKDVIDFFPYAGLYENSFSDYGPFVRSQVDFVDNYINKKINWKST